MRVGAEWLSARPQLGQEVFARGQGAPPPASRPQSELYIALLEATSSMLESREGQGAEAPQTYRPAPPDLWCISDAMLRISDLLQNQQGRLQLERCMPPILKEANGRQLRVRAALASTLVAGLELARDETLTLVQHEAFGTITLERNELATELFQGGRR